MSNTITVVQYRSAIRKKHTQRKQETLKRLKLGKIGAKSTLPDNPAMRGTIAALSHIIKIVE